MSKLIGQAIFLSATDNYIPFPAAFIQSAISSPLDESTYFEVFEDVLYDDFTNFKLFLNFAISISFKSKLHSLVPLVNSSYAFLSCAKVYFS